MSFPRIICAIRAKNEARWIKKVLDVASEICEGIVVLDDGSSDRTYEICKNHDNVIDIKHQENLPPHSSRDLNTIWEMALNQNPDFVLHLDGDEIFQPGIKKILEEEISIKYLGPQYTSIGFGVDRPERFSITLDNLTLRKAVHVLKNYGSEHQKEELRQFGYL